MAEPHPVPTGTLSLRRPVDDGDAMVLTLARLIPSTDAEAFAVLRRAYPASALCERVAAIGRWRGR
ncbi:hypothetical protein [Phreatobacter sp.]|uniref:hypothetical protein n=1 Tax=Phreatobacter sp. TaxID=1966341 RepID=UPI003F704DC2